MQYHQRRLGNSSRVKKRRTLSVETDEVAVQPLPAVPSVK
jgi:hypothetical protein